MADIVTRGTTSLVCEEAIVQAVPFFTSLNWTPTTQSGRTSTFQGKKPISFFLLVLAVVVVLVLGLFSFGLFLFPAVVIYWIVSKKNLHNLVITVTPISGGSEISILHPKFATPMVMQFVYSLPAFGIDKTEMDENLCQ